MGCLSLSIRKAVLILTLLSSGAHAAKFEGIKLRDKMQCAGVELPLQAAGLRDATIFNIRVYVLAMYSPSLLPDGLKDQNIDKRPICFEVHYMRDVEKAKVDEAWKFQFKESSEYPYPDLNKHITLLQQFFGKIEANKGVHLFELTENSTKVYENGEYKGEIPGKEFGKNFLSVFFGNNPPTKKLKKALLRGQK
jgi:hypothetical protein